MPWSRILSCLATQGRKRNTEIFVNSIVVLQASDSGILQHQSDGEGPGAPSWIDSSDPPPWGVWKTIGRSPQGFLTQETTNISEYHPIQCRNAWFTHRVVAPLRFPCLVRAEPGHQSTNPPFPCSYWL